MPGERLKNARVASAQQRAKRKPSLSQRNLLRLANLFQELGRTAQALGPGREAVERYRELAAGDTERFALPLASSLNNLASYLHEAGSLRESVAAAEQAVAIFRPMQRADPEIGPLLASALHTVGLGWRELGEPVQAAAAFAVALDVLTPFATGDPEAFAAWWLELRENLRQSAVEAGQAS